MTNIVVNKITANDIATRGYVTDCLSGYATCDCVANVVTTSSTLCDRVGAIEFKTRTPDVDPTTKTELVAKNGNIYVKHYKDGFFKSERRLMSDITDVRVYGNTVVMMFADKTKTSAVLDSVDTFSVEQGISVCITKKLLGEEGSSIYNKLINRGLKVIKKNEKAAEDEKKKNEADKKASELKKARAERRKAKKRESSINDQAEAIKRALVGIIGDIKN